MQLASISSSHPALDLQFLERFELIEWAEPIIADRMSELYRCAADARRAGDLTVQHRRLWRGIILDQHATVSTSRKELQRLSRVVGLPLGYIEQVDQAIIEELLEIILSRYQASRASVKRFSLILMVAVGNLGAVRAVA